MATTVNELKYQVVAVEASIGDREMLTDSEFEAFKGFDDMMAEEAKRSNPPPVCHFKPMEYSWADDGSTQVEFWECAYCGHTKDINGMRVE